ncbi:MAG: radical SAM protein [bacterium]
MGHDVLRLDVGSSGPEQPSGPAGPLKSLTVVLTNRCNLECRYCYRDQTPARDLTWRDLHAGLAWALSQANRRLEVIFTGGESLLAFPLLQRAVTFLRSQQDGSPRTTCTVLTNGTLMSAERMDFLAANSCELRLSCDGVPPAQAFRGEDTVPVVEAALFRLRSRHPDYFRRQVKVVVTVLPATLPYLADSIAYLLDLSVARIQLAPVLTPAAGVDRVVEEILREQFTRIHQTSLDWRRHHGTVPLELFQRWDPPLPTSTKPGPLLCRGLTGCSPALDVDGCLYACLLFAPSGGRLPVSCRETLRQMMCWGSPDSSPVAQRREGFTHELQGLAAFTNRAGKHSTSRRCADCDYQSECNLCPYALVAHAEDVATERVPDFLCGFNRIAHEFRDRFPAQPLPEAIRHHPALVGLRLRQWRERLRRRRQT